MHIQVCTENRIDKLCDFIRIELKSSRHSILHQSFIFRLNLIPNFELLFHTILMIEKDCGEINENFIYLELEKYTLKLKIFRYIYFLKF